jgi:hypothetical protein
MHFDSFGEPATLTATDRHRLFVDGSMLIAGVCEGQRTNSFGEHDT